MDLFELKKEQQKLAPKIVLQDGFEKVKTIGGAETVNFGNKLFAAVVVCSFPDMKVLESKTYILSDPLPFRPGFEAYREMPALVEASNVASALPPVTDWMA